MAIPLIIAGCQASPARAGGGTNGGAATLLQARLDCDQGDFRKGIAELSWTVAPSRGVEQKVVITLLRDGFEKGDYESSERLPAKQSSLRWERLSGQAIHFWRVLTLLETGEWVPSETAQFEGPTCVRDAVSPRLDVRELRP
jgi:hypothetical protein